jgi:hypothetical protein
MIATEEEQIIGNRAAGESGIVVDAACLTQSSRPTSRKNDYRSPLFTALLASSLVLVSCSLEPMSDYQKFGPVSSPSGELIAYAYSLRQPPADKSTTIYATSEGCIREMAVISGSEVQVRLQWISDSQLQIEYPGSSSITEPDPDDVHACFTKNVNVIFVPF